MGLISVAPFHGFGHSLEGHVRSASSLPRHNLNTNTVKEDLKSKTSSLLIC